LKGSTRTNQSFDVLASLQEPLNSANREWKRLQSGIVERKASLQNALLDMGQFHEALDEMLRWVERTDQALEEVERASGAEAELIASSRLVSGVDVRLARLQVLRNDVGAQEQSVLKLKETGKNLIRNEATGKQTLQEIKQRVQLLIDSWENLLLKLQVPLFDYFFAGLLQTYVAKKHEGL
jgi:dystonin